MANSTPANPSAPLLHGFWKKSAPPGNGYPQRTSFQPMSRPRDVSTESSDLQLARSAAAGDSAAFHRLVDRHAARLFRSALAMTRTRADAEDLLQETFIGAFKSLKHFDGRSSVKTWLVSILMRQAAKSWHRTRHDRSTRSIDAAAEDCSGMQSDDALLIGGGANASDQRMDFAAVLKQLPAHYREVIVLREVEQLSYDEIAQALQAPRGTIESRVHRARLLLREYLQAYAPQGQRLRNAAAG